jgi:SAM-dependent methyltransferase
MSYMGVIGGTLGVQILRSLNSTGVSTSFPDGVPPAYLNRSKLEVLLGPHIWDDIRGKTVVDFGSGEGYEMIELANHGARQVIGVEPWPKWIASAKERLAASAESVSSKCEVVERWDESRPKVDVIISIDSFEHYEDPAAILELMCRMLKPDGFVLVAFGPPWYHPYGGHLFSVFPWAHLIFSERAMVNWRTGLPGKEPRTSLLDAGINQMTVSRFERLVERSPFQARTFEAVPIRRKRWPSWSREFTTSIVRCRLEPRAVV